MDPILGMDLILEILAMEPTTTTKIMVTMINVVRLEMLKEIRACYRCQKTVFLFGPDYLNTLKVLI